MKNKRKVLAPTIAGLATFAMVSPLALTATSCSCSKFAGESMLGGVYTPTFDPYDAGKDAEGNDNLVNIPTGEDIYLKKAFDYTKAPYEEYKWTGTNIASMVEELVDSLNNQMGYDVIKINKWEAKLSDFKVTDARQDRVSYKATQDIDIDIDYRANPRSNIAIKSLGGHVRLAWGHYINNMPLGIFDIGTDNWRIFNASNDKPFQDMTLWFIAPDMSEIPADDHTWSMDIDLLADIDLNVNGDKLIDLDNEIAFKFDKYFAYAIELLLKSEAPSSTAQTIAYMVERVIPLLGGWFSYYLKDTKHYDHIISDPVNVDPDWPQELLPIGWNTPVKSRPMPLDNFDQAYTQFGMPAHYRWELGDGLASDYGGAIVLTLGVNRNSTFIDYAEEAIDVLNAIAQQKVPVKRKGFPIQIPDSMFTTTVNSKALPIVDAYYDWKPTSDDSRPQYGSNIAEMENYQFNSLVPLVMTKDWIALGNPFDLIEDKTIWDMYPSHQEQIGAVQNINTNATGETEVHFLVKDFVKKDMEKPTYSGRYEFECDTVSDDGADIEITEYSDTGLKYRFGEEPIELDDGQIVWDMYIPVKASDWVNNPTTTSPEALSKLFKLVLLYTWFEGGTYHTSIIRTEPFQMLYGYTGSWNPDISRTIDTGSATSPYLESATIENAIYIPNKTNVTIGNCSLTDPAGTWVPYLATNGLQITPSDKEDYYDVTLIYDQTKWESRSIPLYNCQLAFDYTCNESDDPLNVVISSLNLIPTQPLAWNTEDGSAITFDYYVTSEENHYYSDIFKMNCNDLGTDGYFFTSIWTEPNESSTRIDYSYNTLLAYDNNNPGFVTLQISPNGLNTAVVESDTTYYLHAAWLEYTTGNYYDEWIPITFNIIYE